MGCLCSKPIITDVTSQKYWCKNYITCDSDCNVPEKYEIFLQTTEKIKENIKFLIEKNNGYDNRFLDRYISFRQDIVILNSLLFHFSNCDVNKQKKDILVNILLEITVNDNAINENLRIFMLSKTNNYTPPFDLDLVELEEK